MELIVHPPLKNLLVKQVTKNEDDSVTIEYAQQDLSYDCLKKAGKLDELNNKTDRALIALEMLLLIADAVGRGNWGVHLNLQGTNPPIVTEYICTAPTVPLFATGELAQQVYDDNKELFHAYWGR